MSQNLFTWIILVVLILTCDFSAPLNAHEQKEEYPKGNWSILPYSTNRTPNKVGIVLGHRKFAGHDLGFGIPGAEGMQIELNEPKLLKYFYFGLFRPTRPAVPEGEFGAGGSWCCFGHMTVETEEEEILVGISTAGFVLGSKHPNTQNVFYSWLLAKVLDDIVFKQTGKHIPRKQFQALSGESAIESYKDAYERLSQDECESGAENRDRTESGDGPRF